MPPEVVAKIDELRTLLGAEESDGRYRLVFSPVPAGKGELAVHTRSMLQILLALAETVDVPEQHIAENRALPSTLTEGDKVPLVVHSGSSRPEGVYAAVAYRNRWFWIEDTDFRSKRAFAFIMFLFTLSDDAGNQRLPVLTIPTG